MEGDDWIEPSPRLSANRAPSLTGAACSAEISARRVGRGDAPPPPADVGALGLAYQTRNQVRLANYRWRRLDSVPPLRRLSVSLCLLISMFLFCRYAGIAGASAEAHWRLLTALQDRSRDTRVPSTKRGGTTNRFLCHRRRTQTANELQQQREGNANEVASLADALLRQPGSSTGSGEAPSDELNQTRCHSPTRNGEKIQLAYANHTANK